MAFERPQKGNPKQLVIDQHFHTAHAIAKFYDTDDKVEVKFLNTNSVEKRHSRAKVFCTKRNWDQRAEVGFMSKIEKNFHDAIDSMKPFDQRNHKAITKYYLLWCVRHLFHLSPIEDQSVAGIVGGGLSKPQEEVLESKGMMFIRSDCTIPSRFITGHEILKVIDEHWPSVEDLRWGLLESKNGEFIVADSYKGLTFMPISPKLAFAANYQDSPIDEVFLANANKQSVEMSTDFYFAKNLSNCPIA